MAADAVLRRIGLRLRVAAVSAVTVGVALTIAGLLLVGLLRSRLDTAATTAAMLRARDVAALAEAGALPHDLALPGEESAFVQVIDQSGSVIASTTNIDGEPAISTVRPSAGKPLQLTFVVVPLDHVDSMRVVALNATTASGVVTVYAGESLEGADDTITAVSTVMAVGLPLLAAFAAAVTWWGVGHTLRPVRGITRTMADITASDLHRRVDVPAARDEIGRLALTVNDTLARLDTSVEQQRRFVADASHELRGPLASLRADLEISVTHPDRTDWQAVARDTLGDVERLQRLTDDLLLLARLDTQLQPEHLPVDLAAVVRDAVLGIDRADLAVVAVGLDAPAIVDGDERQLQRMVRNLVHNAVEHAERRLEISLAAHGASVALRITDDGPGIPVDQRLAVFERFVRLDTARTRDTGGTGLGLAIVHDVVARHHGTIAVNDSDPHGATFTVEIPVHR
jgi:signal transduction histidine kinase